MRSQRSNATRSRSMLCHRWPGCISRFIRHAAGVASSAVSALFFPVLWDVGHRCFVDLPSDGCECATFFCACQDTEYVLAAAPPVAFLSYALVVVTDPVARFCYLGVSVGIFYDSPYKVYVVSAVGLYLAEYNVASPYFGGHCRLPEGRYTFHRNAIIRGEIINCRRSVSQTCWDTCPLKLYVGKY